MKQRILFKETAGSFGQGGVTVGVLGGGNVDNNREAFGFDLDYTTQDDAGDVGMQAEVGRGGG